MRSTRNAVNRVSGSVGSNPTPSANFCPPWGGPPEQSEDEVGEHQALSNSVLTVLLGEDRPSGEGEVGERQALSNSVLTVLLGQDRPSKARTRWGSVLPTNEAVRFPHSKGLILDDGGMAERTKAIVLKTVEPG